MSESIDIKDLLDDDDFVADLGKLAEQHRERRAEPKGNPAVMAVRAELEHVKGHIDPDIDLDALAESWTHAGLRGPDSIRRMIAGRLGDKAQAFLYTRSGGPVVIEPTDPRTFPQTSRRNTDPIMGRVRDNLRETMAFDAPSPEPEVQAENVSIRERMKRELNSKVGGV